MPHGKLYLVPTPLDFGCSAEAPLQDVLPLATLHTAARLSHWICENAKSTRAFLNRVNTVVPLQTGLQLLSISELPRAVHKKGDHVGTGTAASGFDAKPLLAAALATATQPGRDIGLCSEAGMPAVADPGSSIVRAAHELGIEVVPLVGPVSLLLALAASGLNGQNFAFVGYLPQDPSERSQRIRQLEQLALKTGQTQLFIETPYRNAALATALVQTLEHNTRLALASGLTLPSASVQCKTAKAWRAGPPALDKDTPVVFAIGR